VYFEFGPGGSALISNGTEYFAEAGLGYFVEEESTQRALDFLLAVDARDVRPGW
jgi:hypothetical protein